MLTDLRVRDLGVIEDLTLRLGDGMTALTGETGAGKTLLVEAVALVLGSRAASGLVRSGADEALVEARFRVPPGPARPRPDDQEVVLTRSVPARGRSRAWVDGRMVPLSALAETASGLVDIHGQHDHQSLLSPTAQRAALDQYAGVDVAPLWEARQAVRAARDRLGALGGDDRSRAREADVLRHQVREITDARLEDPGEEDRLVTEEARLADLGAHREAAAAALGALAGGRGEAQDGALDLLGEAAAALAGRPAFDGWSDRLRGAQAELDDVGRDLRQVLETWEDDPGRLAEIQRRRRVLSELRRKYGPTLAEVSAFGADAAARLADLESAAEAADRLAGRIVTLEATVRGAEVAVRRARMAGAPALAADVRRRLGDLAMSGARFEVAVGDHGAGDPVRFLLGANPGEPLQPLSRVASGGELARAMLALRLVALGGPVTMVFDEVDAGVGGEAAVALAGALSEVAQVRQVLVVTHLAQVAALADRQVAVDKLVRDGRTTTGARPLDRPARVVELSRMLSGQPDSGTARAHAEELLAGAPAPRSSTTGSAAVV